MKRISAIAIVVALPILMLCQQLPQPFGFGINRSGQVLIYRESDKPELPFSRHSYDTLFFCEEWVHNIGDTAVRTTSECPLYLREYPDSILSFSSRYSIACIVPVFQDNLWADRISYRQLNDSMWIGEDTIRSYRYIQKWRLDKQGHAQTVELCDSDGSLIATFDYTWYDDGRIQTVTRKGDSYPTYNDGDLSTECSYEYVYDDELRLICFCKHDGSPYPSIADTIEVWKNYLVKVYSDSLPDSEFYFLPPPGNYLFRLSYFTYADNKLQSVFDYGPTCGTDTFYYDDQGRIERIRSYQRGLKISVFEFDYESDSGRVSRSRMMEINAWPEEHIESVYTHHFSYNSDGKIAEIVFPYDPYAPNIIRHNVRFVYHRK